MDPKTRQRKIEQHREAIRSLESEVVAAAPRSWPPSGYYLTWHLAVGMLLGTLGATVSLLANALAAPLFGQRSLELIRVYLTFPMGARALEVDAGTVLSIGCVLYLVTGALYGILIHLLLNVYWEHATAGRRLLVATVLALALWVVNFYLILSWLQPMLLGGNWIVQLVPPWVGALTHLSFAWTIAICENLGWGRFEPYRSASAGPGSATDGFADSGSNAEGA